MGEGKRRERVVGEEERKSGKCLTLYGGKALDGVSFPGGSDESACNAGDLVSIPGLGQSPGGGHANPSSILTWRIPVDRSAQWATDHRVAKSRTQLSDKAQHTVPLCGVGRKGYYLEHKCNQQKNQDNFN